MIAIHIKVPPCDIPGMGLCDFRPQIRKGTCQGKTQKVIILKKSIKNVIHLINVVDAIVKISGNYANTSMLHINFV